MLKIKAIAASAALLAGVALQMPAPALAGDSNGNFQVKVGVTGAFFDDKTTSATVNGADAPGIKGKLDDEVLPTATLTYYFTKNIAAELFCCAAHVTVKGKDAIAGLAVADTWTFPPIVTLQYHFDHFGPFRPYLGIGFEWIKYFSSDVGSDLAALGYTDVKFKDSFGLALQGGFDIDLGQGWSLGLDVKKVWEDTKLTLTGGVLGPIVAKHDVDPLFVTANIGYRFNLSDLFGRRGADPAPLK